VRFFLDNCIAPRIARALHAASYPTHEVVHLQEKFPSDMSDEEWFAKLGEEGDWIIISGDAKISRSAHEKQAWLQSKLTVFFLTKGWMNIPPYEQLSKLSHCFPEIVKRCEKAPAGSTFNISIHGKISEI
jgi:predicted nuclease of predicted toxin-antitoxin system